MIQYAMEIVRGWVGRLLKDERGQDVMEYAVLTGFIGIALAIALALAGLGGIFGNFATAVANCVSVTANPYVCP